MPLYGHELTEEINPIEAGLGFACHLEGYDYPGRDRLVEIQKAPLSRTRVGLEPAGRRVPREGTPILVDGQSVGHVTSGTFSPTLGRPIAMGYLPPALAEPGREVTLDV